MITNASQVKPIAMWTPSVIILLVTTNANAVRHIKETEKSVSTTWIADLVRRALIASKPTERGNAFAMKDSLAMVSRVHLLPVFLFFLFYQNFPSFISFLCFIISWLSMLWERLLYN